MEEKEQPTRAGSGREELTEERPVEDGRRPTVESPPAKKGGGGAHSSQNSLPIAEIRNGLVILKDGSFKVVIEVEAVNFDLMSGAEQEAVEYAYQSFLNSLYFPIQISVQSRRVDADTYLKKLYANFKTQNNMLMSVMIEDYLSFLEELLLESDIMDKRFYVVIPLYDANISRPATSRSGKSFIGKLLNFGRQARPITMSEKSLDKARKELRYRMAAVIEGLRGCGLVSHPLNTQRLIAMYYEYYNPETTLAQPLGRLSDLTTPFVSKAGEYRRLEEELPSDQDELFGLEEEEESGLDRSPILAETERQPEHSGKKEKVVDEPAAKAANEKKKSGKQAGDGRAATEGDNHERR